MNKRHKAIAKRVAPTVIERPGRLWEAMESSQKLAHDRMASHSRGNSMCSIRDARQGLVGEICALASPSAAEASTSRALRMSDCRVSTRGRAEFVLFVDDFPLTHGEVIPLRGYACAPRAPSLSWARDSLSSVPSAERRDALGPLPWLSMV